MQVADQDRNRLLGAGLVLLGAAVAAVAVLGPFVSGVIRYRTSPTTLNQIIGGDAAALAVVAPVALAVGIGALRHRPWARKPIYAMVGAYSLIGASVTGMAITMAARDDPDSSATVVVGSALMTAFLTAVAGYLYRPLFRHRLARLAASPPGTAPLAHVRAPGRHTGPFDHDSAVTVR
ncbi:hypothetical protein BJ973_004161 [Actinoplanes tereljensis]|uniref:Uncharacterized protein n=1 Tax=Paractinoplanes tereljensis TaxID=571912 RepID=A0A919NTL6_9ACTN|nr:hypothetical protein [Actinoplanes tereljensis]GIF23552.1 hypothetical protein Ate02nite_62820 [Actinoplanes tereljensis]